MTAPDATDYLIVEESRLRLALALVDATDPCPDCAGVLGVALVRNGPGPDAYDVEVIQRHSVPCPVVAAEQAGREP